MESLSNDTERKRRIKSSELEGRKDRKNALQYELNELRQTRQDTTAVAEKLATVVGEIAAIEKELGQLG